MRKLTAMSHASLCMVLTLAFTLVCPQADATDADQGMHAIPVTAATESDRTIYRDIFRTLLHNDGVIDARERRTLRGLAFWKNPGNLSIKEVIKIEAAVRNETKIMEINFQGALNSYKVPTFEALLLDIHGNDVFSYDDSGALSLNVGSTMRLINQSPMSTFTLDNTIEFVAGMEGSEADFEFLVADQVSVGYAQYVGSPTGFNFLVDGSLKFAVGSSGSEVDGIGLGVAASGGLGYGRMVDARTVAQAAAIFEGLKIQPRGSQLLDVAEIIGQRTAFNLNEREEAEASFYTALAKAVGTDDPFSIKETLESPIYQIGQRLQGWEVGAVADFATGPHGGDAEAGEALAVQQFFRIGFIPHETVSFWVQQDFSYGLIANTASFLGQPLISIPDEGSMNIHAQVGVNWDHTIQWMSLATMDLDLNLPTVESDPLYHLQLHLESNYALTTRAVIGGYFNLCFGDGNPSSEAASAGPTCSIGDDDVHYSTGANFTYRIF
jgi:hypothetical protein